MEEIDIEICLKKMNKLCYREVKKKLYKKNSVV